MTHTNWCESAKLHQRVRSLPWRRFGGSYLEERLGVVWTLATLSNSISLEINDLSLEAIPGAILTGSINRKTATKIVQHFLIFISTFSNVHFNISASEVIGTWYLRWRKIRMCNAGHVVIFQNSQRFYSKFVFIICLHAVGLQGRKRSYVRFTQYARNNF
jgi:hypothetical protein